MFSFIYNQFLYLPLLNALIFIYNNFAFESLGLAVILLTIIIRLILFPFFHHSTKNQTIIQKLQPKIKELTEKHKNNKEEQIKKIMELYKEHKVNPFSGLLLLIIQLPILIALFYVFYNGFTPEILSKLYPFITEPSIIHFNFLGLINLQESSIIVVVLAVLSQYFQAKLALPKKTPNPSSAEKLGQNMVFIAPFITAIVLFNLPSVIGIYWITTSLFSIGQQIFINRSLKSKYD